MPNEERVRRMRAALALTGQRAARTDDPPPWYRIDVRAETVGKQSGGDSASSSRAASSTADVYVFDRIGGWFGVSADDFVRDVAGLDVDHINLHLNSPGGDAAEGTAIANVLRQHRADVTVWVDGLAASAASVVAMAGDEVVMGIGAQLMIHDAWALSIGDAGDMRKAAAMLDSTSNALASTYAAKAGGTAADWRAVMQAETWYTAEEAVTAGLADRVATEDDNGSSSGEQVVPGQSSGMWDLWDSLAAADRHADVVRALYAHAGRADAPPPRIPAGAGSTKTPAASADGSTHKEGSTPVPFTDEHLASLRTKLGLPADADEDKIVATVAEVMEEFVKEPDGEPAKAALPEGAVAVDKELFEQLRADAAAGREAREEQRQAQREQLVQAAVKDGRIAPASKEKWLNALKVDPDGEKNLASLEKGLIPVNELGHGSLDSANDQDNLSDAELDELAGLIGVSKEALR